MVTVLGMVIEESLLQPEKVRLSMVVMESGRLTEVRRVHARKAWLPINVTESGIVIDNRLEQS